MLLAEKQAPSPHLFVEQTAVIDDWLPHLMNESNEADEWWCISTHLAEALEEIEQPVLRVGLLSWWRIAYPEHLEAARRIERGPEAMLKELGLHAFLA